MRETADPVRRAKLAHLRHVKKRIAKAAKMVQATDESWADAVQHHNLDAAQYLCMALDRLADDMEVLYADQAQTTAALARLQPLPV